ncbi:I78 family peptidase inhibitor [Acinetobacter sp.]|uniref:I78 family peptidase inhibitor n=1 Tax=Acinetobacter sp. TaxID=472 RepID=UPI0035B00BBF
MKYTILLGMAVLGLSACSTAPTADEHAPKLGMENPASRYCIDQGGKLEIKNEKNGQVGYCHLPNGAIVEEWALFRSSQQGKCQSEAANKLVGQSKLSESQIKQLTGAEIVRSSAPGQPLTMDYRENRVTVTVDSATGKIIRASCG